jgi:hypothetical protein
MAIFGKSEEVVKEPVAPPPVTQDNPAYEATAEYALINNLLRIGVLTVEQRMVVAGSNFVQHATWYVTPRKIRNQDNQPDKIEIVFNPISGKKLPEIWK